MEKQSLAAKDIFAEYAGKPELGIMFIEHIEMIQIRRLFN
jgi:hypothetical protein